MNKHHAPSFLFSLIIHILALFIIYNTYEYIVYIHHRDTQKKVSINLKLCIPEEKVPEKKLKEVKKTKKVEKTKKVKKVLPKKKQIPKKVIKKIVKKQEKRTIKHPLSVPVIKKEVIKEESIKKESKKPKETKEEIKESNTASNHTKEKIYIDNNLEKISQLLSDNLYYPRRARKRGITGKVLVSFKILQDGTVSSIKIISSKSEILSKAATKTINDLSGKFPKPSKDLTIEIPIEYRLR